MSAQRMPRLASRASRQRGQAMLLTVLLLTVGVAGVVYTLSTPATIAIDADKRTAAAMALARDALIGYAAKDANRPGSLPCPDTDDDGSTEIFVGAECAGYIGRLPWRTLGLPDLRDGYGEHLWYAVSREFARNPSCGAACPLNSDTAGQLTITGSAPAANVIAIVFAPGLVVGVQNRSSATSSLCSSTATTILNSLCPANYLEGENSNGTPPTDNTYTTGLASATLNDQLLPITSDALFNVVNVRVAKEAIAALVGYRSANGYYPFANTYGSAAPYNCSNNVNIGRFPITLTGCGQPAWGGTLPGWFGQNNWNLVTHYAISKSCGQLVGLLAILGPLLCGLADEIPILAPLLALLGFSDVPIFVTGVTGTNGASALVILTGRATGAQVHPCASAGQCLEDASNSDGNAIYVKPSRYPASNDRMAVVCDIGSPCPVVP